jgi:hypothetical protein
MGHIAPIKELMRGLSEPEDRELHPASWGLGGLLSLKDCPRLVRYGVKMTTPSKYKESIVDPNPPKSVTERDLTYRQSIIRHYTDKAIEILTKGETKGLRRLFTYLYLLCRAEHRWQSKIFRRQAGGFKDWQKIEVLTNPMAQMGEFTETCILGNYCELRRWRRVNVNTSDRAYWSEYSHWLVDLVVWLRKCQKKRPMYSKRTAWFRRLIAEDGLEHYFPELMAHSTPYEPYVLECREISAELRQLYQVS